MIQTVDVSRAERCALDFRAIVERVKRLCSLFDGYVFVRRRAVARRKRYYHVLARKLGKSDVKRKLAVDKQGYQTRFVDIRFYRYASRAFGVVVSRGLAYDVMIAVYIAYVRKFCAYHVQMLTFFRAAVTQARPYGFAQIGSVAERKAYHTPVSINVAYCRLCIQLIAVNVLDVQILLSACFGKIYFTVLTVYSARVGGDIRIIVAVNVAYDGGLIRGYFRTRLFARKNLDVFILRTAVASRNSRNHIFADHKVERYVSFDNSVYCY